MSRIRVLQVVWRLARGGGQPLVVRELLRHIDRSRFEVHVCTVRPLFEEDRVADLGEGISYHALNLEGRATMKLRARALAGIARVVRRVRPHVLHAHGGTAWYSVPAALLRPGAARLIEVHDAPQSRRLRPLNYSVERFMVRHFSFRPMAHSGAVRDGLAEAWGLPQERIVRVGLGIDLVRFAAPTRSRAAVRAELGIPEGGILVTYVARLVPEKRPELFLDVAARIAQQRQNVFFALVGVGSQLDECRGLVRRLGLDARVRIPGFVEDLPSTYHASDLFLSTSAYEGFGLAIAEAMASGLPVVSTRVGGVGDVIGSAGVLVPSGDPQVLAGHVLALLDDPAGAADLGRRARERAREHLDVRETARGFEAAYRELVA